MTMQLGLALVLGVALCLGCGQSLLRAPARPFSVLWNVPSAHCKNRFGVPLPLEALGISANRGQHFHGQNVTIFYKNQLGFYPYLGPRGTAHNGGIPQAVPLGRHLARAAHQIRRSLWPGFARSWLQEPCVWLLCVIVQRGGLGGRGLSSRTPQFAEMLPSSPRPHPTCWQILHAPHC